MPGRSVSSLMGLKEPACANSMSSCCSRAYYSTAPLYFEVHFRCMAIPLSPGSFPVKAVCLKAEGLIGGLGLVLLVVLCSPFALTIVAFRDN